MGTLSRARRSIAAFMGPNAMDPGTMELILGEPDGAVIRAIPRGSLDRLILPETRPAFEATIAMAMRQGFYLAGGTALSWHLDHRKSRDFDFFMKGRIDTASIRRWLDGNVDDHTIMRDEDGEHLAVSIAGTKVDFVGAQRFTDAKPVDADGIRTVRLGELAAMKMFAAVKRRKRRDMHDLSALANHGLSYGWMASVLIDRKWASMPEIVECLATARAIDGDEKLILSPHAMPWDRVIEEVEMASGLLSLVD